MSRYNYSSRTLPTGLTLLQANVGRRQEPHDALLQYATEYKCDVVLVQEPWTQKRGGKKYTKTSSYFLLFTPSHDWAVTRPKVLTYVRRASALRPVQLHMGPTHHFVGVSLQTAPPVEVINVYRQPQETIPESLNTLFSWTVKPNSIIAGDFNTHHQLWESNVSNTPHSDILINWMESNNLRQAVPPNTPTQDYGHTIDLVLSNSAGLTSRVLDECHTASDHVTIFSHMPIGHSPPPPARIGKLSGEDADVFRRALAVTSPPALLDASAAGLDAAAENGTNLLSSLLRNSARPCNGGFHPKPWWNDECRELRKEYNDARRSGNATASRAASKAFRRAVKGAKRRFKIEAIEAIVTAEEAHRVVGWRKSESRFAPPPLIHEGNVYSTPAQQARVLFSTKLCRVSTCADTDYTTVSSRPRRTIPAPIVVTEEEVKDCLLKVKSTSPGPDSLSVHVLRHVWEVPPWREWIFRLYELCLALGHHPRVFRRAEVIFIPKPFKDDLMSPRNWRPISLLPVLGKGLERLIARRMAFWAIDQDILSPTQLGALPGRSAIDLVESLLDDVHRTRSRGHVCTLATLDVEGAYDSILPGRLSVRLREQGWPPQYVSWAASFAASRQVQVKIDHFTDEARTTPQGLPQGSPASPILFLLFLEPLFTVVPNSYGYVDDVAILSSAANLEWSSGIAANRIKLASDWCSANGLSLAPGKMEIQHFHRSRAPNVPEVIVDNVSYPSNDYTRWLGFYFDSGLTFKPHVTHWANQARKVIHHVRQFGNTVRGCSPKLLRTAALAATLPVLLYGAEAWWIGPSYLRDGRQVSTRSQGLVDVIQRCIAQLARAVLPVYKTTPVAALLREAWIPPADILLEKTLLRSAVRLASADPSHPCAIRMDRVPRPGGRSHLQIKRSLVLSFTRPILLPKEYRPCEPSRRRDEVSVDVFKRRLDALPSRDLIVYSDGSKQLDGNSGAGAVLFQHGTILKESKVHLGSHVEVYDAEIVGALMGLKLSLESPASLFAESCHVVLDNQEASRRLSGRTPSRSSQREILEFHKLARSWPHRSRLPGVPPGRITVMWSPGHVGIAGNERADTLAKEACSPSSRHHSLNPSLAGAQAWAKRIVKDKTQKWWSHNAPPLYVELGIPWPTKEPGELSLPRRHLGYLVQCRTKHGDFEEYHRWLGHDDSQFFCSCGRKKDPIHFAFCAVARRRWTSSRRQSSLGRIDVLLGSIHGARRFSKYLAHTGFLTEVCKPFTNDGNNAEQRPY